MEKPFVTQRWYKHKRRASFDSRALVCCLRMTYRTMLFCTCKYYNFRFYLYERADHGHVHRKHTWKCSSGMYAPGSQNVSAYGSWRSLIPSRQHLIPRSRNRNHNRGNTYMKFREVCKRRKETSDSDWRLRAESQGIGTEGRGRGVY